MKKNKTNVMLSLVRQYHSHQTRNGGKLPYWIHCLNVGNLLQKMLHETREGTTKQRRHIILAGYGHDLIEDTPITRELIIKYFGPKVDHYIWEVTKPGTDAAIDSYISKLTNASESALLIKLSDIYDNLTSSTQGFLDGDLPRIWMENFLIPILDKQWQLLRDRNFTTFPKTAAKIKEGIFHAWQTVLAAMKNTKQQGERNDHQSSR